MTLVSSGGFLPTDDIKKYIYKFSKNNFIFSLIYQCLIFIYY